MSFLGEIKRRKVFQVGAVYLVVAWLIMQVVDVVAEPLNLPGLFATIVIVLLAIGLPIALIFAWVFDVTPDGVVRDTGQPLPKGRSIDYVLFGVLIVAVGWVLYRVEFDQPESIADSAQSAETAAEEVTVETSAAVIPNSIAVLPFENLSLDPEDAFFAAGIHESTLNQLAKIHDLAVMSRSSVMQYAENRPPIRDIARELSVETVMEGSVRYAGGRVLITAQLIDGRTDTHLWSEEFNKELTDVFAVQAEVARQIAAKMKLQLLPDVQARIESRPTESAEAYAHYLHALSLPLPVVLPELWPTHVDLLTKAINTDPTFADAYAQLANIHYARPSNRQQAVEYARRAIELDPTVGLAYMVIAMRDRYYYDLQDEARANFERAIELSPNDPDVIIASARHLAEQSGEYHASIATVEHAILIDSSNSIARANLGLLYMRAGKLETAAAQQRRFIDLQPRAYTGYLDLATTAYLSGDKTAAKENLDRAVMIMYSGATFRTDYIAYLYGLLGELDQVNTLLEKHGAPMDDPQSEAWETLGWAALGTRDTVKALDVWTATIDGYINDGKPVSLGRITRFRDNWLNDPMLEEPEFLELRRRLGYEG